MRIRVSVIVLMCLVVTLVQTGVSDAATYQLQVANISERVFMYFVEDRTLPRIEAYLADKRRSQFVAFRDRRPLPLDLPHQSAVFSRNVKVPQRNDPWGVTAWDGEPGQLVVFRVRSSQSSYQRLKRVAVQANGTLTRIPVRNVPASQVGPMQVPVTAGSLLVRALEDGTFSGWAERRAVSYDGLSVIVGRHHNRQQSDAVYLVIRLPQAGQAYKVVLGWETVKFGGGHPGRPGQQVNR